MNLNPLEKYKATTVRVTSPIGQMLFIFDEIIKSLYVAQKAFLEKNYELKHKSLAKITEVIMILDSGFKDEDDDTIKLFKDFYKSFTKKIYEVDMNMTDESESEYEVLIGSAKQVRDTLHKAHTS